MTDIANLARRSCQPCRGDTPRLEPEAARRLLAELDGWQLEEDGGGIWREVRFASYYETMAFVNAVAYIAHREDHHPDLEVSYASCRVRYMTHAIGGLSESDFICAAKVDELLK